MEAVNAARDSLGRFGKGNNVSRVLGASNSKINYSSLWRRALAEKGQTVVDVIYGLTQSEDKNIALKASDLFFKYARPLEKEETDAPQTDWFHANKISLEEAELMKKRSDEMLSEIIKAKSAERDEGFLNEIASVGKVN